MSSCFGCLARSSISRPRSGIAAAGPPRPVASGDFVILEFLSQEEEGDGEWDDGSGWLSSLIPLRDDLAGGDHRALYLAWLLCVQAGELKDGATEPPVPAGLASSTAPLQALADFLRIDDDLLTVAAHEAPAGCVLVRSEGSRSGSRRCPNGRRPTGSSGLPVGESLTCERSCCEGSANLVRAILLVTAAKHHERWASFWKAAERLAEERRRKAGQAGCRRACPS